MLVYRDHAVSTLPLPRHALGHIFDSSDDSEQSEEGGGGQRDPYWSHWCVDPMNLKDVVKACPKLRRLTLDSVLAAEAEEIVAIDIPRALRKLQVC